MASDGQREAGSKGDLAGSVEKAVSRHIGEWAATIGLKGTDTRLPQFHEDVAGALRKCINMQIAEQVAPNFTRIADMRKYLERIAEDARTLAGQLRVFTRKYVTGQPTFIIRPGHAFDLTASAQDLDAFASHYENAAATCRDKGGQPPMLAFAALAEGLIRAYRRATNRRGTGRSAREGKLLDLVEAVLPKSRRISIKETGKPLRVPRDVGNYLHRVASRL